MDFLNLAKSRFSARKFENRHLPQDVLDKILEAGHCAPTGCNFQPQRILVINSDESIRKLKKCTKCHFDAPSALLVCYCKDETWKSPYNGALSAPVDAAIVTTHLMLQAFSLGVGSCWVMHFDPEAMKKEYNIPKNVEPLALLVMGYPAKDCPIHNFHNEFRPMEEVVYYDSFDNTTENTK